MGVAFYNAEHVSVYSFWNLLDFYHFNFFRLFFSCSFFSRNFFSQKLLLSFSQKCPTNFNCFPLKFTSDLEPEVVLHCVAAVVRALIWPFFYCHFANVATDCIASIGDIDYGSNWYDFPTKLRKHAILIIARSQQPLLFTGLGLMRCTIETFGAVRNSRIYRL